MEVHVRLSYVDDLKATMLSFMARPIRYTSEVGREATLRNPNIEALAADARNRALERIGSDDLGPVVEDPLGALMEEPRSRA